MQRPNFSALTNKFFQNISQFFNEKLIFIAGKGGVGRSTVAASLGHSFAKQNKKTLIVQWSLTDSISPFFNQNPCTHKETQIAPNLFTMNYDPTETIREYFVNHLKLKFIYHMAIENKHVKKLLQAAPGVSELFFLGRLFWLCELSHEDPNKQMYEKIVVDLPASGHGVSLFGIAPAITKFGMTGPLATESERVTKLLKNPEKTGVIFTCVPEELSFEELLDFTPKIKDLLGFYPKAFIVNQSYSYDPRTQKYHDTNSYDFNMQSQTWAKDLLENFSFASSKEAFLSLVSLINQRIEFERKITDFGEKNFIKTFSIPAMSFFNCYS